MYPHERSLVNRYKNKPFVLLGVDCNEGREVLQSIIHNKTVTWPCFWDGAGSIQQAWQVSAWPTMYVIDRKGIIRYENLDSNYIDGAVDSLIKESQPEKAITQ